MFMLAGFPWWSVGSGADGGGAVEVGVLVDLLGGERGDVGTADREPDAVGAVEPDPQLPGLGPVVRGGEADDRPVHPSVLDHVSHADQLVVRAWEAGAAHEADQLGLPGGLLFGVEDAGGAVADIAGHAVPLHRVEDVPGAVDKGP